MIKIILLDNKNRNVAAFIIIAALELLAVFFVGYLSIEQSPTVYIVIISATFSIIIMALLLRNINIAVYFIILFSAINNINFLLEISSSPNPIMFPQDSLGVPAIIVLFISSIFLLLYKSTFKSETNIYTVKGRPDNLSLLLFTFIVFCILSVLWSPEIIVGLNVSAKLIVNYLMYLFIVVLIKNEREIITMIRALVLTAVIIAISMLISIFPIDFLNIKKTYFLTNELSLSLRLETYQLRAAGFVAAQTAAQFLGFGVLFSMGLLSQSKVKKEKIVLFLIIIFLILIAFYTKARGAILSTITAMLFLVFAIKYYRAYLFRNLCIFTLCLTFLFGVFYTTHSYLHDYIRPFLPTASYIGEHSLKDRLDYWEAAYKAFTNNDAELIGLGAGGALKYIKALHVHNLPLSILIDFGLIGFILFFILIFISIIRLFLTIRNLKEGLAKAMLLSVSGCIIALGLASLVDINYTFTLIWLLMGTGVVIYRYAASETV